MNTENSSRTKSSNSRRIFLIILFFGGLLADSIISDVLMIAQPALPEQLRIVLFTLFVGIAVTAGFYLIRSYTDLIKGEIGKNNPLMAGVSTVASKVQYVILGLLAILVLQIIFSSEYYSPLQVLSLALSWFVGVGLLILMTIKFVQWSLRKRSGIVMLFLGVSATLAYIYGIAAIPSLMVIMQSTPLVVDPAAQPIPTFITNPEGLYGFLVLIGNIVVPPLSIAIWVACAVMLRKYSRLIGRKKLWILLAIPLASNLMGNIPLLVLFSSIESIFDESVIVYTILGFGGLIGEGFLLGYVFSTISRSIKQTNPSAKINQYLGIAAVGTALLFVAFFANPAANSYPPFGTVASSFYGFGAFLFFVGIYSSAVSISTDLHVRQMIRKSMLDQSKFFDSIGTSETDIELQKQMAEMVKKQSETLEEATGIESAASEEDLRDYVQEVMAQLSARKSNGKDTAHKSKDSPG